MAVNPEELRERRLAYFQSKSKSSQSEIWKQPDADVLASGMSEDDIVGKIKLTASHDEFLKPKDPDKWQESLESAEISVSADEDPYDLEAEFSRQDYRVNSPLKEVKLKPCKYILKPDIPSPTKDTEFNTEDIQIKSRSSLRQENVVPSLSLKDSQNVSIFNSVAEIEDLGLSTHRPISLPSSVSVLDKCLNDNNPILNASEIKSLLGEDKYEEFLRKSVKDINALYQNKTTETSPHLLDEESSIGQFTETEVSTQTEDKNHMFNNNNNTGSTNNLRQHRTQNQQVNSSQRMTTKNVHDLERENQTGYAATGRNYDQVLVSRNVTFSADEIYRQAYGGRFGLVQMDPRIGQQNMPVHMSTSPPYSVVVSPRQQSYPVNVGVPTQSYQPVSPGACMYNGQGDYFMSPTSPVSPQASYYQPYYPRQQVPRQYMPQVQGASPPNPGFFNYPPPGYNNMNNSNQYQMYIPRPPQQPHQSQPTLTQNPRMNNQPTYYPHNHYNKFAKNTNIQKEAMTKHQRMQPVPVKQLVKSETEKTKEEQPIKGNTSQRHKEAVRQYHEQRRNQNEDLDESSETQKTYAASSLNRYFSSLENLNSKSTNTNTNEQDNFHVAPIDEEVDDLTTITDTSVVTSGVSAVESGVTSATSIKAGGITDRIAKLGITIPNLRLSEHQANEPGSKSDKKVKICPECSVANKDYMTWCLDCGEILIGVEAIPPKKKKNKKDKMKKVNKVIKKDQFGNDREKQMDADAVTMTSEQEHKYLATSKQVPKLQIDTPEGKNTSSEQKDLHSEVSTEVNNSDDKPQFDPKFYRTEKDINDICEVITDPVIRGYIRSYFNKKTKSALDKTEDEPKSKNISSTHLFGDQNNTQDVTSFSVQIDSPNKQQPDKSEMSLDLNVSNTTSVLKEAFDSPIPSKSKGYPFGKKLDNVDIEVFGMEESKEAKSSSSSMVPSLNLVSSSSDEDEDMSALRAKLMVESSVESDVFQAAIAPKNSHENVQRVPEKKDSFLAQILGQKGTTPKKTLPRKDSSPKLKRKPIQSKITQSINSTPHQRRWEKSNLAWSAIHPREVNLKSSVSMPKARIGFLNKNHGVHNLENFGSGEKNITSDSTKRQRPASAELYKRKVLQQRPTSALVRSSHSKHQLPVSLPLTDDDYTMEDLDVDPVHDVDDQQVTMPTIVDHRLPAELPRGITQNSNLVRESSLSAYNKYIELTPRIQHGDFSPWVCMPDEIWLHIFSYLHHADLKNCGRVSKQFHRVALDEVLWKCIAVKKQHAICDDWLLQIGKRNPISLALIQCHGDKVSSDGLKAMFQECCQTLRELNFTRCSRGSLTGDSILLHAAERCHNLTHLDASWCHVTDTGMSAISESSKRLESVCINGCQVISDVGLENLIKKHGGSLRVLEMFGCFNISQKGLRFLANNCYNLLTLNLGQCYKLTDSCMTQISANLGRIEHLDLRGCKQIRDTCIRKIVRNCPRIKTLVLANCPNISDTAMVEVATYSMDIRNIDVCGCKDINDISIKNITNNCQRLTSLDISSTGCTSRSVHMLANYGNRCLETAKLNFLTDVTEGSLVKLVKHCSKLKTLHLYGCVGVRNIHQLLEINKKLDVEM